MSVGPDWLDANSEYLAASLQWLRLRLKRLAQPTEAPAVQQIDRPPTDQYPISAVDVSPVTQTEKPRATKRGWIRFSPPEPANGTSSSPSESAAIGARARALSPARETDLPINEAALAEAAIRRDAAASSQPPPGLVFLSERMGLTDFERDTLLLCAAAELDPTSESLFAAVQGSPARTYPTFGLALRALDQPTWDALSPHRPLRFARLVEVSQPGATPLIAAALRADERIVNLLKGMNVLDERMAALVTPVDDATSANGSDLAPSQQQALATILERLKVGANGLAVPSVHLLGSDASSKLIIAVEICRQLNRRLYLVRLDALPITKGEVETFARLWQRENTLLPVALYIDAESLDAAPAELQTALRTLTEQDLGLVFVALREAPTRSATAIAYAIEVEKPTPVEQYDAWLDQLRAVGNAEALGTDVGVTAQRLAGQFNLNLRDIRGVVELAARSERSATPLADRAWDTCRDLTRPRLDALAQRLIPKATWSDLVVFDESTASLRQIVGQVRERFRVYEGWGYARKMTRGLGISALFTGESGVGKTMAAEVIANELRLYLYRVDLSAVVSKYIGETEKNLRRLFDAAEQGGAILFFDEADALFGKRSEVKDSHDRYANIEINYLLQRMEGFSGLAILATNIKGSLDTAFMRRLRFIIHFQFPGLTERKQIWKKVLPPEVPCEELDYDVLARFHLSGGNIQSIALNAAFLAAQRATPVNTSLIMSAVRAELRKLDKPINEAEFR